MSSSAPLLWVPLKKTSDINVGNPVEQFVKTRFAVAPNVSAPPPKEFSAKMKEFQKLRQAAIKGERGEGAANAIAK